MSSTSHAVLLGLRVLDSPQLVQSVQSGLPYSSYEQLLANTAIPNDVAMALVGIPKRTLTRRKREGRFNPDESDRLLRVSRIFARALGLFDGDRDAANQWLTSAQRGLAGVAPLTLARTEVGALEVERLIGRLEHGVFS